MFHITNWDPTIKTLDNSHTQTHSMIFTDYCPHRPHIYTQKHTFTMRVKNAFKGILYILWWMMFRNQRSFGVLRMCELSWAIATKLLEYTPEYDRNHRKCIGFRMKGMENNEYLLNIAHNCIPSDMTRRYTVLILLWQTILVAYYNYVKGL